MINDLKLLIREVNLTLRGVLIPDTWQQLEPCDVLLFRHELNSGYVFHGIVYSRLIDSIGDRFAKKGLAVGTVALPYSRTFGIKAYNNPVSYSRSCSLICIFGTLIQIFRGKTIGTEWMRRQQLTLLSNILNTALQMSLLEYNLMSIFVKRQD